MHASRCKERQCSMVGAPFWVMTSLTMTVHSNQSVSSVLANLMTESCPIASENVMETWDADQSMIVCLKSGRVTLNISTQAFGS